VFVESKRTKSFREWRNRTLSDILKGLTGGWNFLVSWVFPSAIAWSVFALFLFPELQHVPIFSDIAGTSPANKTLVLAGAAIFTGLLLNSLSTVLFRVIEVYYPIPPRIETWLRNRQQFRQQALRNQLQELKDLRKKLELASAGSKGSSENEVRIDKFPLSAKTIGSNVSQTGIDIKIGLLRERLRRYPADDRQLGSTQFANALRAIETYGWDRYRLDSQILWSELISAVPDSLRTEEESARSPINFSVSMIYLSALLGVACLAVNLGLSGSSIAPTVVGVISLLLVPVWYKLAVLNTRYLRSVQQAIVNIGRVELAKKMGLTIPRKLQDEREMWEQLFWFVDERFDEEYVSGLDSYRLEEKEDDQSSD
jgi:hypothetical protein